MECKTCTKCRKSKPLDEFYRHSGCSDGLQPSCKLCMKISSRKYHRCIKAETGKWPTQHYREAARAKWASIAAENAAP